MGLSISVHHMMSCESQAVAELLVQYIGGWFSPLEDWMYMSSLPAQLSSDHFTSKCCCCQQLTSKTRFPLRSRLQ